MAGLGLFKAGKKNKVVTMHDVSLLHEIEKEGKFLSYYQNAIKRFVKEGIPVIMVSENAKQDALNYSDLKEEQLFAVHNGVNFDQFFDKGKQTRPNDPFQLAYAGGLGPRKNVNLLLEACSILESRGIDYHLKIAGTHAERTPYPSLASKLRLKNVTFTGFIAEDRMNDFYNDADLFIYTSKYEGFGFAPLEAMAAGTPVITTTGGSLKEVAGGGAALVDYNSEEIAEKIIQLMDDEKQRVNLIERGKQWVKQYTWENCAKKTLEVYKTVLS
ncbi:MAG: glycosyltransferase family 4 protein [Ekhidna sp.]|nr:glycosyltransferase family 4 protein [Ekhidna sp.]